MRITLPPFVLTEAPDVLRTSQELTFTPTLEKDVLRPWVGRSLGMAEEGEREEVVLLVALEGDVVEGEPVSGSLGTGEGAGRGAVSIGSGDTLFASMATGYEMLRTW